MKTTLKLATALLALTTLTAVAQQPYGPPPPPPNGYGQQPGYGNEPWSQPPGEYSEVSRRGFHDGIEGARRDVENHRRPNPNNRDEFRHPNVPGRDRRAYRDGFVRGYQTAMDHMMNRR